MKTLYICSSQFSGTTLISFLLNNHSSIATIGHTTGWHYAADEDFRCSCGDRIRDCRLFVQIQRVFEQSGLPFDPQDFGTAFKLSNQPRINQLLTGSLPFIHLSPLELLRDRIVDLLPHFGSLLTRQQTANVLLMQTVVAFLGASVYLDNSHSPYRLRLLNRNPELDVYPVHLIRDPRGVSLSMMTNSGFTAKNAIVSWINHQLNIFRIANEVMTPLLVCYEDLCRDTDEELSRLHKFVGIEVGTFRGDFKEKEHHILGNRMRLTDGVISLDERWKRDLSAADLNTVEGRLQKFRRNHMDHPLAGIVADYLESR